MEELQQLGEFLDTLAYDSPTPGGGTAAALSGAMGASLVSMVARLTIGKKKYAEVESTALTTLQRSESLRAYLVLLMEKDEDAFGAVMNAYHLPKESENQKNAREEAIQTALKHATLTPLETARACAEVITLSETMARIGNTNAISDAGTAAVCATAGFKGAALNVLINLANIQDKAFAQQTRQELESLTTYALPLSEKVYTYVQSQLGIK